MNSLDGDNASDEAGCCKQTTKLRRSCESCRSSKGRCIPCPEDSKECLRCMKDGRKCVFLESKPRPRRAKTSRVRVAEMEEKLEGLLAILASNQAAKSVQTPQLPTPQLPTPQLPTPPADISSLYPSGSLEMNFDTGFATPMSDQSMPQLSSAFSSYLTPVGPYDVISRGFLDFDQAEAAIRVFQSKVSAFPFVVVPSNTSLKCLRYQRPFLLLAVLCCGSGHNEELQSQLELEIRENLSRRVTIDGEKSLDILQGLLVYITWYHLFFSPFRDQMYQLCQTACAMAIDLEIDRPVQPVYTGSAVIAGMFPIARRENPDISALEARRTFLGCFYATSSVSQKLRKSNHLKYKDYMTLCAQSLARAAIADTDYLIPHLLRIAQVSDEVKHAFDYNTSNLSLGLDPSRTELLVKSFEVQLAQMESTFPREVWSNVHLRLSFYHLRTYVYEVGFHASNSPSSDPLVVKASASSWYHSPVRNGYLLCCLDACKTYLDTFLTLADNAVDELVMVDFLQLVYAMLLLESFSFCDTPALDSPQLRRIANFDYYLRTVISRSAHIIATRPLGSNNHFKQVFYFFEKSRVWYNQMIADPEVARSPSFPFLAIVQAILMRCIDFSDTPRMLLASNPNSSCTDVFAELDSSMNSPKMSLDEFWEQYRNC